MSKYVIIFYNIIKINAVKSKIWVVHNNLVRKNKRSLNNTVIGEK